MRTEICKEKQFALRAIHSKTILLGPRRVRRKLAQARFPKLPQNLLLETVLKPFVGHDPELDHLLGCGVSPIHLVLLCPQDRHLPQMGSQNCTGARS
eukprot:712405-Pyramimonas_sp.AAC.1